MDVWVEEVQLEVRLSIQSLMFTKFRLDPERDSYL